MITNVMSITPPRLRPELRQLTAAVHLAAPGAWLVGGALRDLLDGREPVDLDFVTTLDARSVANDLAATLGGSPFPLDEVRKTWRIVLPETAQLREIDISTIEKDLEADLRRRDFTVDALAAPVNPDGTLGAIVDLFGGVEDLRARRLCMLGESALQEDPLRLLRAVRLAVEMEMTVDDETADAVRRLAPSLNQAAAERQRDELVRIFETPRAAEGVRLLDSLGLLDVMLPELGPSRGCEQPLEHHYWDVFNHLVQTVASLDTMLETPQGKARNLTQSRKGWLGRLFAKTDPEQPWLAETFRRGLSRFELDDYLDGSVGGASRRALIKLAGLLHDVSKPETKTVEPGGRVRFFGHPEQGAVKASAICKRLRFGGRECAFVSQLVEEHLRPTQLADKGLPSRRALYRFFRDLGDAAPGVLILSLADASAARGPRLEPERWRGHVAYIAYVLENGTAQRDVVTRQPRLVTGSDLIEALGLEPGPEIGRLLAAVEEAVAAGEVSSKQEAIELASGLTSPASFTEGRVPLRPRSGTVEGRS
jgi:poly(A) polymerase